jgi:hypothetical protein
MHLAAGVRIAVAGQANEAHGEASGEIQEMQLLDLPGEAPQLGGQARKERYPKPWILVDELLEWSAGETQGLDRLHGSGGGGVRRAVEQRKLAEEVAGSKGGDDRLVALRGWQDDLHRSGGHHVERVARIALVEDDLVAPESAPNHGSCKSAQSHGLDMREEGALLQAGDREFLVPHVDPDLTIRLARAPCGARWRHVNPRGFNDPA